MSTVLLKQDGWPTYHFANVVDDHLMGITHVLRGGEWMTSTGRHIALYRAFGWQPPVFAHLPLLINENGSKLSKRRGDAFVQHYRDAGYLPCALVNYVAGLGWSLGNGSQMEAPQMLNEIAMQFSLDQLNRSPAQVNKGHLDALNKAHIARAVKEYEEGGDASVYNICMQQLRTALKHTYGDALPDHLTTDGYLKAVMFTLYQRVHRIEQMATLGEYFWVTPTAWDADWAQQLNKKGKGKLLPVLHMALHVVTESDKDDESRWSERVVRECAEVSGMRERDVMPMLRFGVTSSRIGGGIAETMYALGRRTVERRLVDAIDACRAIDL